MLFAEELHEILKRLSTCASISATLSSAVTPPIARDGLVELLMSTRALLFWMVSDPPIDAREGTLRDERLVFPTTDSTPVMEDKVGRLTEESDGFRLKVSEPEIDCRAGRLIVEMLAA
jgi:hypothetical protein